jgi:hypothetical protein
MSNVNENNPPYISDDFQICPDGAYEYTEDITVLGLAKLPNTKLH